MSKSNKIHLFSLVTKEYEPFEKKSLDMLKHLLNNCESVYMANNIDGDIELVFEQEKREPSEKLLKSIDKVLGK